MEHAHNDITDRLRAARGRDVVVLQTYNIARSKHPGVVVIAVEGGEDPIFYKTLIRAVDPLLEWVPVVCNGKDNVLALRLLLERNVDIDASKTYFAVDKDFDGLKGHQPSKNLYCTPCYSFENLLVTPDILMELLIGEYRCSASSDEIDSLRELFENRLCEFFDAMALVNRALHFCRVKRIRSGGVDDRIKQYISITLDSVTARYRADDLSRLVGLPDSVDIFSCETAIIDFDSLDPRNDWRGKFLLSFFVEFLAHLQEDRCSEKPTRFVKRHKISFNPRSSIVRVLASMIAPPSCLEKFVRNIAA